MAYTFQLDQNESVITTVHRHWITLLPITISAGLLIIAVAVMSYLSARYGPNLTPNYPSEAASMILAILGGLAVLIFAAGWYIYRNNQLIVTNMHLVNVEQNGLFGRSVSQLELGRLQDVSGRRNGFFATILDYGTVVVETAGEEENFVFNFAPHPQVIADDLLKAHEQYATRQPV